MHMGANILVYGHKANTLHWVEKYLKEGADGIEIDVYQQGAHILVEHKRQDTKRRLLREKIGNLIAELHVRPALQLSHFLHKIPARVPLILDLKNPVSPLMLKEDVIKSNYSIGDVLITTRWHNLANSFRAEGFRVLLSIDHRPISLKMYKDVTDGLSLSIPYVDRELLVEARRLRLIIALWVVNEMKDICNIIEYAPDALIIITEYPRKIKGSIKACLTS